MTNLYFPISGFLVAILLLILFFTRKRVNYEETKIYSYMLISSGIDILISLIVIILGYICYNNFTYKIIWLLNKIDFIHYILWPYFLFLYVYYITYKNDSTFISNKYPKIKHDLMYVNIFIIGLEFIFPLNLYNKNGVMGISGLSTIIVYLTALFYLFMIFLIIIKNIKKVFTKKYIPIFVLLVFLVFIAIIRIIQPNLLVIPTILVYINLIMYFTIENPDIKLLNELYRNKVLVEQSYEDKYNFLFEMTEQVKQPIANIRKYLNDIKDSKEFNFTNEKIELFSNELNNLDFLINNVLDISSIDVAKIKKINAKYDLKKVIDKLVIQIKEELGEKINLNVSVPNCFPILYGDYMIIQQILYSILIDSCQENKNNLLEFKVNLLEKTDTCRLIFSIRNNFSSYSLKEINDILSVSTELSNKDIEQLKERRIDIYLCQKIIKLIDGHLMIKSNVNGTEIIFVIDQKKYLNNKDSFDDVFDMIDVSKKILVLSKDKKLINNLKEITNKYEFNLTNIFNEDYAIDILENNSKIKFVLVTTKIFSMSAYEFIQKIKKSNIKVPIIIMLNKNEGNLAKYFVEDGFADYLIIENYEQEIKRLLEKYS